MIRVAKLDENIYKVDDNELPLGNPEVRKLLTSYAGMSDIEANQWLDELEDKKENTFEPKEANQGVVVNIYEVEYPAPADPNKETQEMAKHLDEYKDFVSQQVFPGSQTEDIVVDLRKNLQPPKQVQKLNWRVIPELSSLDKRYIERTGRIDYKKLEQYYGMNLDNWAEVNVDVYGTMYRAIIGKDIFRYLVSIQIDNEVGHHSVDYSDLVEIGLNPYDFKDVVQFAIENGPDETIEDSSLDDLLDDEEVIKISSQKLNWSMLSKKHQELMDEAYDLWQQNKEWNSESFIDNLPSQAHKDAVVLGNLNYQVGNGGFVQWYGNNYGERDDRYLITELLPRMGTPTATEVATLVRKAGRLNRQAEELAENDQNTDYIYEQLDKLDDRYYEIDDTFEQECEEYLQRLQTNASQKLNWRDIYRPGNPDDFFKTDKCDRCGADISKGPRTMSWFNHDTICWECSDKEYEYKKTLPNYGTDLEGTGLPEELTPTSNWRNKLQWREDLPNFVWLPGIKVRFKETAPIDHRTFGYDNAEHPYGEDYTIPTSEIGTVVARNDDPDNDNVEVIFDNLKKLFKEIPLICFKEDLELLHPHRSDTRG